MTRKVMLAVALAVASGCVAQAQMGAVGSAGAGDPAKSFDTMLTGFEQECMAAAKAMPAEKYVFTPASLNIPGAKFDGVRTFVQEVTHIAEANYHYYAMVSDLKYTADAKAMAAITTKEDAIKLLAESFAYAHRAIATLTPSNAWDVVKRQGTVMGTRASLAGGGVAHGFDHYGQMVEYLRMNGIVPPASAK